MHIYCVKSINSYDKHIHALYIKNTCEFNFWMRIIRLLQSCSNDPKDNQENIFS